MFLNRCDLFRQELHNPAITTDVIVGFPGETEEDFEASCEVSRQAGFSKIHVFPFSARKGTKAADFDNPVPKKVKSERCKRLMEVESQIRSDYFQSLVGQKLIVMAEQPTDDGHIAGTSCRYAPVRFVADDPGPLGKLYSVTPTNVVDGVLQ